MATDEAIVHLLDHAFAALCAQPVGALLDADALLDALDAAAAPERLAWAQSTLVVPARTRFLARAAASEVLLGAWLPAAVSEALARELAKPMPLPKQAVEEAVGSEKVREATRQMLSDTLTTFVQRAAKTLSADKPGAAPAGGLRGALGFGAKMAGSVIGGLTEGLQQQLLDKVREQVDGLVGNVQQRIVERLTSEETAKALGQRRAKLFARGLATTEREAVKGASKVPWAEVDAMAPTVVAHNLARPAFRDALRDEVAAVKASLDGMTVGDLLDHLGQRAAARGMFVRVGAPMVRAMLTDAGRAAMQAVLGDATETAPAAS